MRYPFQVMPKLAADEFAALEASILENGVLVAVEFDEFGQIIDGHHRVAICKKHGIKNFPRTVRAGLNRESKRALARELNIARRHLNRRQKRRVVEDQLRDAPSFSNRMIAAIAGVDNKTVGSIRRRLIAAGVISASRTVVGMDGKVQPASKPFRDDPWSSLRLSDGSNVGDCPWYELSALIRERERDLRILRGIQKHCIPDDTTRTVREVLPLEIVQSYAAGGQP